MPLVRRPYGRLRRVGHKPLQAALAGARAGHARRAPHLRRSASVPASAQSGRSSGVEHNLAKVGVEGSNPFARSSLSHGIKPCIGSRALVRRPLRAYAALARRLAMTEQAELTRPATSGAACRRSIRRPASRAGPTTTTRSRRRHAAAAAAHTAFREWRRTSLRRARGGHPQGRRNPARPQGRVRPADDRGDGQDARRRPRRGREMRLPLRLVRRPRRTTISPTSRPTSAAARRSSPSIRSASCSR